ncbi:MAG TPA: GDYXXLXY domain-containing protein [Telluria sp.]|jgi:uncharacterized membrane-anchored protein
MNRADLEQLVATAITQGLLPAGSELPSNNTRPWPVILLTALGAWLAAVPLIAIFFVAFNGVLYRGAGPFIVSIPLLIVTVALLRRRTLPLFAEQMLVPALVAGTVILGWGLIDHVPLRLAGALLAILACAAAAAIHRNWLRVLLGFAACVASGLALIPEHGYQDGFNNWAAIHLALLVWCTVRLRSRAEVFDHFAAGWGAALLTGLSIHAGLTFLLGAQLGAGGDDQAWRAMVPPWDAVARAGSVLATTLGAGWLARRWPSLRAPWAGLALPVLLGLSWLMPSLGGGLLILALSVGLRHWRMGTGAGVAAAWIIGAFYYQAAYPLHIKAAWLLAASLWLAAIAGLALRGQRVGDSAAPSVPGSRRAGLGIALCAVAVLTVANIGIWQKETLIAEGRPIFVELAPVDPRSLMQGDYMQLRFRMLDELRRVDVVQVWARRPHVVASIDSEGIATVQRLDSGTPLAPNELSIELTAFRSGWSLASDGWYFKEGDAARWARAKYGEFRVDSAGHALLVGMRGPGLEPL